jgi:hypothetical protein
MGKLGNVLLTAIIVSGMGCAAEAPEMAADTPAPEPVAEGASGTAADVLALPGATIDRPAGWVFGQPSSSMRLAEAEIPGPDGPALLTVFFFGAGGGGGVDANLQRWAGQVEPDDGAAPVRGGFTVDGFTVSTIEVEGTLLPSGMGTGPTEPVPGSKLVGAVIEGPGGPWFFKITGPEATVSAAAPAFDAMLRSIR